MKHQNNHPLPLFHLVIPCYEESKRLPSYLSELASMLKTKEYRTNILVVDDGSSEAERNKLCDMVHELREIDFIAELKKRGYTLNALIAGDGTMCNELESLAKGLDV